MYAKSKHKPKYSVKTEHITETHLKPSPKRIHHWLQEVAFAFSQVIRYYKRGKKFLVTTSKHTFTIYYMFNLPWKCGIFIQVQRNSLWRAVIRIRAGSRDWNSRWQLVKFAFLCSLDSGIGRRWCVRCWCQQVLCIVEAKFAKAVT